MSTPTPPPARPRRSNADYRWTLPKVTAFLEALALSGRVAEAARTVGMSRQAAYKLRARLDGPRFRAAFENARKAGIHARMAASRGRPRSRWEGPGIAALDHLRQGDSGAAQGDGSPTLGDTSAPQGDTSTLQGDATAHKATKVSQDSVTTGPCLSRIEARNAAARRGLSEGGEPRCSSPPTGGRSTPARKRSSARPGGAGPS